MMSVWNKKTRRDFGGGTDSLATAESCLAPSHPHSSQLARERKMMQPREVLQV